jgi:hypothetical protein
MAFICKKLKKWILPVTIGLIFMYPAYSFGQKSETSYSSSVQPAVAADKVEPLMLRNISAKFGPVGHEKIFIEFSRDVAPESVASYLSVSSIAGKDPRIVIDTKNVLSARQGLKRIEVQGRLVRQVRSNLDHASRRLRIVVDLVPSKHYDVKQVFYKAENTYMLDITEITTEDKR